MGERKVLNKYYPPDFDPSKLPRRRSKPQKKVTSMLPIRVRCNTCGNYMAEGTKFNVRQEDAIGEKYLGEIQIKRFYHKCTNCSAEFSIKTDPENSDYTVESGATRVFPHRRHTKEANWSLLEDLEKRCGDEKRRMDAEMSLEERKAVNSRREAVDFDSVLEGLKAAEKKRRLEQEEEDEAVAKFASSRNIVRRISDEDLDELSGSRKLVAAAEAARWGNSRSDKKAGCLGSQQVRISVVKKKPVASEAEKFSTIAVSGTEPEALQSAFQIYSSDNDDDH
ncbi:unnamed protein product [Linum trigynum]|uniref:Splicing factor YJU2 n=1 Tax=Linum trigynum TaxID=586398 RepID=A0AAV2G1D8_9ROSI